MNDAIETPRVSEVFADVARRVLADPTVPKTPSDRQFLWDLQRRTHAFKAPTRLIQLCERSADDTVRDALGRALIRHAHAHEPAVLHQPEAQLELAETIAQGDADVLQKRRQLDPRNPMLARALCDSLLREEEAARRYRECVELEIPT